MNGSNQTFEVDRQDVEFFKHKSGPLLAQVYRPRGKGPFPMMIELHGGAWTMGDRNSDHELNEAVAQDGIVVVSVDYRMPPTVTHPDEFADVNYAIRWAKAHASEFGGDPKRVGGFGTSSGGSQILTVALQPEAKTYRSVVGEPAAEEQDATLGCVVLCWPVINPISRYRMLKRQEATLNPVPALTTLLRTAHDTYWLTEEAMTDGTPEVIIERGDHAKLPPVLYVQAEGDTAHPGSDMETFLTTYKKHDGKATVEYFTPEDPSTVATAGGTAGRVYRSTLDRLRGAERERVFGLITRFIHASL